MLSASRHSQLWITHVQFLFFVFCLSLLPAAGQMAGVTLGNLSDNRYKLSGTVVNSVTGEPIPHALVQVYSQFELSDSNGHFEFSGLPEMQTNVTVRKP